MSFKTQRVTMLESYYACPQKFHEEPWTDDIKKTIAMYTWDIWHIAHQYPSLARKMAVHFCKNVVKDLTGTCDNILLWQLNQIIDIAEKYIATYKERWTDLNYEIKLNKATGGLFVTWSSDCVLTHSDWTMEIHDYKITKSKAWYEDWSEKLQPIAYSNFIMTLFDLEKIDFSYIIYEKKATVQVHKITKTFSKEETEEKLQNIAEEYISAEDSGLYFPKRNKFCFFCSLKKEWRCELYKDNSSVNWKKTTNGISF